MTDLLPSEQAASLTIPLEERTDRILGIVNQAALEVGQELIEAKAEHPGRFMAWVDLELPFSIDKAERLMAITRAFATADEAMLANLPSAYSALYELSRMPTDRLTRAVETGDVTPDSTVRDCRDMNRLNHEDDAPVVTPPPPKPRLDCDIVAGELVRFPRSRLSGDAEIRLRRWLG